MEWVFIVLLAILLGLGFAARNNHMKKRKDVAVCKYCGVDTALKNLIVPTRCPTCGVLWKIKNRVVNVMFK